MLEPVEDNSKSDIGRHSTGIVGLDFQLNGGFPAGNAIVVYGDPLSGCDHMAEQFWRADKSGESTYLMIDGAVSEGMLSPPGSDPEALISMMEGDWIVVDSLSTVILEHGIDAAVGLLKEGLDPVRQRGGNVLCIVYSGLHTPIEEIRLRRAADIFISLEEQLHGNELERRLAVHKIPCMTVPSRLFPYMITENGIELSTTDRVV